MGLWIVFDGPPGPESGRFVEVETDTGKSVGPDTTGAHWEQRANGLWRLGPFAADIDYTTERDTCREAGAHVHLTPPGVVTELRAQRDGALAENERLRSDVAATQMLLDAERDSKKMAMDLLRLAELARDTYRSALLLRRADP